MLRRAANVELNDWQQLRVRVVALVNAVAPAVAIAHSRAKSGCVRAS